MSLLDSILSVASGGATGIIGAGIQTFAAYKTKQLDIQQEKDKQAHEVAMVQANAAVMAQEWAARAQVATIEGEARVEAEDAKAFAASMTSEPKQFAAGLTASPAQSWLMFLLDFLRGAVRPVMTFYLCILTTVVAFQAHSVLVEHGYSISVEQALALWTRVIDTVLYLSTCTILWWFGTRATGKK